MFVSKFLKCLYCYMSIIEKYPEMVCSYLYHVKGFISHLFRPGHKNLNRWAVNRPPNWCQAGNFYNRENWFANALKPM